MSIMKAFVATLIFATVFVVISLIHLNQTSRDVVPRTSKIYPERRNPTIPVPQMLSQGVTKKNQSEGSFRSQNIQKNPSGRVSNTTRPKDDPASARDNSSLGVETVQINAESPACEEKTSILLLKTHKTGSSTLQNVLYRFGDKRDLNFALPVVDVYMGTPAKFKASFAMRLATPTYDILANHARFHKENMKRAMTPGAKFVTILRYPPKQFESMYSFYRMKDKFQCSLEEFASSPETIYGKYSPKNPKHSAKNPMLYSLGMELGAMNDSTAVDKWIKYLDDSFDLVLIAEHLKESLILLRDMMCWTFDDITYLTSNARSGMLVETLSNKTEKNLLGWLSGDFKLYQHFNSVLWTKIENYGVKRMVADVAELEQHNLELKHHCVQGKKKVSEMSGRTVIERYMLRPEAKNDMQCKRITYSATDYLSILKNKMKMRRSGVAPAVKSARGAGKVMQEHSS